MGGPEGLNNNFLSTLKWSSEDLWEKNSEGVKKIRMWMWFVYPRYYGR